MPRVVFIDTVLWTPALSEQGSLSLRKGFVTAFFSVILSTVLARLVGIEPTLPAPEAGALSTELQARICDESNYTMHCLRMQGKSYANCSQKPSKVAHMQEERPDDNKGAAGVHRDSPRL